MRWTERRAALVDAHCPMLTLRAKVHVAAFPVPSVLAFDKIPHSTRSDAPPGQPSLILLMNSRDSLIRRPRAGHPSGQVDVAPLPAGSIQPSALVYVVACQSASFPLGLQRCALW